MRVNRLADLDGEGCNRVLRLFFGRMFPEGPGDQTQIRGFVVGPLQQLALLGIVPPGLCQRVEYGRVADAESQVPQQDAHHIFGRYVVYACEQAGKSRTLLFDRSFPRRQRDGSQLLKHFVDT